MLEPRWAGGFSIQRAALPLFSSSVISLETKGAAPAFPAVLAILLALSCLRKRIGSRFLFFPQQIKEQRCCLAPPAVVRPGNAAPDVGRVHPRAMRDRGALLKPG